MIANRTWFFWVSIGALFFFALYAVQPILLPFIVGMLVAYLLDPAADWLESKRLSRTAATLIICALFFVSFALALLWFIPALSGQIFALLRDLPQLIAAIQQWLTPYIEMVSEQVESIFGATQNVTETNGASASLQENAKKLFGLTGNVLEAVLQSTGAVVNMLSLLFITPIVSFYLLRDWDRMVAILDDLLPRDHADTIREQCAEMNKVLSGFIRGTFNVSIILGVFYMVTLSLAGLNYALIIGLIGGFAIIIPYLGTLLSGLLAVGMAIAQFDNSQAIAVIAIIFVIGQMLEGNFLTPKLVGEQVGLHPVWIIFGMLAGATLLGFVGVLLAVPLSAAIGVLVRFAVTRYRESSYYSG